MGRRGVPSDRPVRPDVRQGICTVREGAVLRKRVRQERRGYEKGLEVGRDRGGTGGLEIDGRREGIPPEGTGGWERVHVYDGDRKGWVRGRSKRIRK